MLLARPRFGRGLVLFSVREIVRFFKTPNQFLSKHRIDFFQNAESNPFKTPNRFLSKHRIDFFQNTESVSFKTPNRYILSAF